VNRPEWITHDDFGGELRLKNRKVLEPLIEEALAAITVEEAGGEAGEGVDRLRAFERREGSDHPSQACAPHEDRGPGRRSRGAEGALQHRRRRGHLSRCLQASTTTRCSANGYSKDEIEALKKGVV
jgi:hypothetical protein